MPVPRKIKRCSRPCAAPVVGRRDGGLRDRTTIVPRSSQAITWKNFSICVLWLANPINVLNGPSTTRGLVAHFRLFCQSRFTCRSNNAAASENLAIAGWWRGDDPKSGKPPLAAPLSPNRLWGACKPWGPQWRELACEP